MTNLHPQKDGSFTQQGIECPICLDALFSDYLHDYKHCTCGMVSIDGGLDYLRYGWETDLDKEGLKVRIIERAVYATDDVPPMYTLRKPVKRKKRR